MAGGSAEHFKILRENYLPRFGWPEKLAVAAWLAFAAAWAAGSTWLMVMAGLAGVGLGVVVAIRVGRFYVSKLIWRLRYRLMVAFMFITAIPMGLLLVLFYNAGRLVLGQVAAHLAYSRLERELELLENSAALLVRSGGPAELAADVTKRFPGAQVRDEIGGVGAAGRGLALLDGKVHGWGAAVNGAKKVAVLAPLTKDLLVNLDPSLGPMEMVTQGIVRLGGPSGPNDVDIASAGPVPAASNRFDTILPGVATFEVPDWDKGGPDKTVLFYVATRPSALYRRISSSGSFDLTVILAVLGALFLVAQVISILIGVSITRTMTAAVHNLYEGTVRVMQGDFSYRIPVKGNEQIADLSRSFNAMTENVERLLKDSKEKERMQAELEIARRVQGQLFPSEVPVIKTLEVRAVCQPARQVSGDYYDYQRLTDAKTVLALGDVAGKGISAALLMASLQSTLRVQLREWKEGASTERLVKGLNQHLFLNTTPEKYATFFLAIYDEAVSALEYTNAGHLPPLLIRNGAAHKLDINGMVVGAFPFAEYDSSRLAMEPGDVVVCYTDGVTELENEFGEQFGEQRLADVLIRSSHLGLDQIEAAVLEATERFSGSPDAQDDLTMLIAKRTAAAKA